MFLSSYKKIVCDFNTDNIVSPTTNAMLYNEIRLLYMK